MLMVFACLGVMVAYVAGALMSYETLPYVMLIFPIGLFVSYLVLPDTPMSLMSRKKASAAESSLKFYLNCADTSSEKNKERFDKGMERLYSMVETSKQNKEKFTLKDFGELVIASTRQNV